MACAVVKVRYNTRRHNASPRFQPVVQKALANLPIDFYIAFAEIHAKTSEPTICRSFPTMDLN
jgi:hypothetical protein